MAAASAATAGRRPEGMADAPTIRARRARRKVLPKHVLAAHHVGARLAGAGGWGEKG
jgi:hypothetical protein